MDLEAAKIILSKLEKYGGDGAAVVEWAKKIIERERERAIEREVGLS